MQRCCMVLVEAGGHSVKIIRTLAVSTVILLAVLTQTRPVAAQNWSVVGGALAGAAAGGWVGLGYLTVRARRGEYVDITGYTARQVAIPVLTGLGTGIAISVFAEDRLGDAVLWGTVGWAAGLGLGAWIGGRIWDDPPGPWAGAAIGGAAGLLVGGIVGFVNSAEGTSGVPAMVRIPL